MKLLNLGCQIHYFPGWINQDIVSNDPNIRAEIYSDCKQLPLEDSTIDFIYAGHLIEHFYPDTVDIALKEWHRVLKPGGRIVIVTPNFGKTAMAYARGEFGIDALLQPAYGRIYHYDSEPERHHMLFDSDKLYSVLSPLGWRHMEDLDFMNPPSELVPFMNSHISRSNTQLGIICTK